MIKNIMIKRNILGWLIGILIFLIITWLFILSNKSSNLCILYSLFCPFLSIIIPFFLIRIVYPIENDQLD